MVREYGTHVDLADQPFTKHCEWSVNGKRKLCVFVIPGDTHSLFCSLFCIFPSSLQPSPTAGLFLHYGDLTDSSSLVKLISTVTKILSVLGIRNYAITCPFMANVTQSEP